MPITNKSRLGASYLELIKDNRVYDLSLSESVDLVVERCASILSVSRVSIWISCADDTGLKRVSFRSCDDAGVDSEFTLSADEFPDYFASLGNERVISTANALNDSRIEELADPYLIPLNIRSLLHATLRYQDKIQGVLCIEMVDEDRDWSEDENVFAASVADLMSKRLITDELAKSEDFYKALYENTSEGIGVFGGAKFVDVNAAMCQMFAATRAQLVGASPIGLSPEYQNDGRRSEEQAIKHIQACLQGKPQSFEWTHMRLDGTCFPANITLNAVRLAGMDTLFAIIRDITDEKMAEEQARQARAELEYRVGHDSLTGLFNRDKLHSHLGGLIGLQKDSDEESAIALLLFDLNRFKEVNDTLGHATGDKVLVEIAKILHERVVEIGGSLFRLGGDEFVAVFSAKTSKEPFDQLEHSMHQCLKKSITIDDISLEMGASIGIAVYPQNGKNSDELLRCADVAMYHAKTNEGLSSWYDVKNDANNKRRLAMMVELGSAIRDNELVLHYQPRISIDTGNITGCEALVRWKHPKLGMVSPGEFIPLAEMSELIHPLTDWVLVNVIEQIQGFVEAGYRISIAMNVSARNLTDMQMIDRIESLLNEKEIDPSLLEIEITESALISHPQRAMQNLNRLYDLGVPIAIDDFGTGYSSLSYLKKLPVNTLKIDQSFVKDMLEDESDAVIVDSTINLAHNFSLTVVAEGVEDQATLAALGVKCCDQAQGFHIARPMTSNDFYSWLAKNNNPRDSLPIAS